jgi:hypothetical protein
MQAGDAPFLRISRLYRSETAPAHLGRGFVTLRDDVLPLLERRVFGVHEVQVGAEVGEHVEQAGEQPVADVEGAGAGRPRCRAASEGVSQPTPAKARAALREAPGSPDPKEDQG